MSLACSCVGRVFTNCGCPVHDPSAQRDSADGRYAEGQREATTCRHCGSPIWKVYHGANANHTVEPRDDRRYVLIDPVTGARIYAGDYTEAEVRKLAERLARGDRYEIREVTT